MAAASTAASHLSATLLLFLLVISTAVADTCLAVYRDGGAPAVFASADCPDWVFPVVSVPEPVVRSSPGCHPAAFQGRRRYMEDRPVCALDIPVPFHGSDGVKEINSSLVAVFDGHNGAEASELSSRVLVEYFLLHAHFLTDPNYSLSYESQSGKHIDWNRRSDSISEKSYQLEILQESVLRTLNDIENEFFEEAYENGSPSGTTASVVLITDGQIFVANIGDSKSFLCSQGHTEGVSHDNANSFYAKELTVDHHPDREDERTRVEAAGGYVSVRSGIAFINGGFPLSRAIGDLPMRGLGVIPVPEVTDWQPLSKEDSYLVVASDGIFERMTTTDVCNLLQDVPIDVDDTSLSKYIVNAAYKGGSSDNLSAIVIPLTSSSIKPEVLKSEVNSEL